MANTEIITTIMTMTQSYFTYMLPIIGVMSAITFIVTWFHSVTLGMGRRTFKA